MTKFTALLFIFVASFAVQILTCMWGWGLEVTSWGWVSFGWLASVILVAMSQAILLEK